jgi:Flp pilus assembly pilin Flp
MWLRVLIDYATFELRRLGIVGVRLPARSRGQSMVEYAIVAALIAVVAMAAVQALGGGIAQVFQNILSRIQSIGTGG